ncbi:DoxX family protein [Emticicia sp. 21SJ11W-3]|uniref:DoxX family protein n=1 Tax=Emticicia sp. 21SJ11W-3 TaxID=2916755 RepID=UPI0020A062A0|nr:DoxX family protein [Emticicia sp. 21SJ11W-3]UTA66590.1 DoxX family protein [Emticicia sp. 21SJ11W-3]
MNNQNTSKIRNITAWLCQILLSAGFLWAAYMKLFQPIDQLARMWPWTGDNPTLTRVAGLVDLLGGLGIILPTALRIKPVLTLYAAYGTILLMLAASAFHISRGEASQIGFNIFFAALAVFVAWARR